MLQAILFLLRPLFDDRPIDFLGRLSSELFAESACAFAGTGQWQDARDRRVQAANHTKIDAARLMVFATDVPSSPSQKAVLVFGRTLHDTVCWLVQNQQMIVFKKNLNGLCPDFPGIATAEKLLQVAFATLLNRFVDLTMNCVFVGFRDDVAEDTDRFWEVGSAHS